MKEAVVTSAGARYAIPPLLRMMRPANIVTAYADILAGYAAAGVTEPVRLVSLLVATTGLYGGGIVLNDVFDAKLDSVERPERPIPSRAISAAAAGTFGYMLLAAGVGAAFLCSPLSGTVAMATASAAVLYDGWGKHQNILGPANMGLCRGLNLALGMTVAGVLPLARAPLGLVTLCYIAGITALSRGEVRGGTRGAANISLGWLAVGAAVLIALAYSASQTSHASNLLFAAPIMLFLLFRLAGPFSRALRTLEPRNIGLAIKAGILSLIVLDAALATLYGGPWFGVGILCLYAPAMLLAKFFAVT